jgi:hypothetical protein
MRYRVLFLALALVALSALAGAATLPVSPAPAAPAAVATLAPTTAALPWLQPAANSTPVKPDVVKPGTAPLGGVLKSACSQGCLQDEFACYNGCAGDHECNVNCNNDYYCCLDTCNPLGPQCF